MTSVIEFFYGALQIGHATTYGWNGRISMVSNCAVGVWKMEGEMMLGIMEYSGISSISWFWINSKWLKKAESPFPYQKRLAEIKIPSTQIVWFTNVEGYKRSSRDRDESVSMLESSIIIRIALKLINMCWKLNKNGYDDIMKEIYPDLIAVIQPSVVSSWIGAPIFYQYIDRFRFTLG